MARLFLIAELLLLLLVVSAWAAFKWGALPNQPVLLAGGVAVLMVLFLTDLLSCLVALVRRRRSVSGALGRGLMVAGLLVVFGGGMTNWLRSLQGYVILTEREEVPLVEGSHLQSFEAGPLSDVEELGLALKLLEVTLVPADDGFLPESHLLLLREGHPGETVVVRPRQSASSGSLWFHQGAFGFAPRIVILEGERQIFDRTVPFTTERLAPGLVSFVGDFRVEKEDLNVSGSVDLSSLDEQLKGHARLGLNVQRGSELLGTGELLPGHFADLEDGYRVGFAGLSMWSEIDISRRTYPWVMLAGLATTVLGAIVRLIGAVSARRTRRRSAGSAASGIPLAQG